LPKSKKIKPEKEAKNPDDIVSSSGEEEQDIMSIFNEFPINLCTKDEILRKKAFLKQKKILQLLRQFFMKKTSKIKQKGLSDDFPAKKRRSKSDFLKKTSILTTNFPEIEKKPQNSQRKAEIQALIAEKPVFSSKNGVFSQKPPKIVKKNSIFDIFFLNSSKKRYKLKIF